MTALIETKAEALRSVEDHGTLEGIAQWLIDHLVVRGDVRWDGKDWVLSDSARYLLRGEER